MRKNLKDDFKKFLTVFLAFSMIFTLLIGDSALAYITDFGSTHIFYNEEREIAQGVVLNNWQGQNPDGTPKLGHTITFDPRTSDATIVAAFGSTVNSRKTLSSLSILTEKQGVSVIGGINGDYYHLVNGVPIGIVIQDGRIVSNSTTKWNAVGFRDDGSVIMGSPVIDMKMTVNGVETSINNFNKAQSEWGPFLYSSDFGPNTGSTVPSQEVVLDIKSGELGIGKVLLASVAEIRKDAMATPLRPNQLVLSARNGKYGYISLSQLKLGDEVLISFNDATNQWNGVRQAIGGEKILISNGAVVSGLSAKNYDPTTALGVKANGEVVLYQVDGRDDASQGVSSLEVAQFLFNLGCTQAIQLDGGGSSAILARMPGYGAPTILNNPSDGKERANANGLLLISKQSIAIKNGTAQKSTEASKIHLYPNKAYAVQGAQIKYMALASDDYYFKTEVPSGIVWGSPAGAMDAEGKLTVGTQPGSYQILAGSDTALGRAELTVLSDVTSLVPSKSVVQLLPGGSVDLGCNAYYQDIKVYSLDSSFVWQVEGNIGTVTQDGLFTMAQGAQGKGRIKVSYGNASATIDVVTPDSTGVIEDFENGLMWGSSLIRAKSGKTTVVQDQKLAKSGSSLLKVDYDFTLDASVQKGVAGVYAFGMDSTTKAQTGILLDNKALGVGMWVYGDNSKTWLRGKVKDGKGQTFDIDFTPDYRTDTKTGGVDWTGWKYVEAVFPAGRQGPFTLETPIRIMCSRDEMRTKGTMYFDQIKAVYVAGAKDNQAPVAKVSSPADKSVVKTGKVALKAEVTDGTGSGVDVKSIQVLLDGAAVPGLTVTTNGAITVSSEMGASLPLADGMHTLTFSYSDNYGNKGTSATTFTVETGAPQAIASTSPTVMEGGSFTTDISIKNPKNLRKIYLVFSYDPLKAELADADSKAAGKQVALEAWVKKGKIITHLVDEKKGRIVLEIDNLTNLSSNALSKLGSITFKARNTLLDSTQVRLELGAMIVGKNPASQRFSLPTMQVKLQYGLTLKAAGTSLGDTTVITVTDVKGNPVEGAGIYIDGGANSFWVTDKAGQAKTSLLGKSPVGSSFSLKAKKGTLTSNPLTITISEKSTGLAPQNLSLSLAPSEGAVAINYLTPAESLGTVIQYAEERTFKGSFSASMTVSGQDQSVSLVNVDKTVPVRVHSALLTNLKPGTAYVYRVGDTSGKFSGTNRFTTPNYDNPYSFIFLTDPQSENAASYNVFADALGRAYDKAVNPAFALFAGDLADRGGNKGQWDMMFNSAGQLLSSLPVMAVPGNHEYYDDPNLTNFKAMFSLPVNGPSGFDETVYSFQTRDALFLMLDTQKNLASQMQWLEEQCKASDKKWKIVTMHRGIYSGFYDEAEFRKVMAPVFDRAGIDLVLNGHDHTYLRTTMKAGQKVAAGAGTTYITGGSSAKKYYDAKSRAWTEVLYDTNNPVFTTFKVYPDRIAVVSSHIENGKTVDHDSFEIVKR